jgi:hypothetical protein
MTELTQIPLDCLIEGRWYVGRGRHNNVGLWDGKLFLVIGWKIDSWRIKQEPYYTDESGCFQPFLVIDEGQVLEPMSETDRYLRYARRMEFSGATESANNSKVVPD